MSGHASWSMGVVSMFWFLSVFRKPSNWKLLFAGLALSTVIATVLIDFTSPSRPEWSFFDQEELPSDTEAHGAKAAILAMVGAAVLVVGFIQIGSSSRSKKIDLLVQGVGAVAVGFTGWFWLLSATNGNPTPYLIAIVPSSLLYVFAFGVGMSFRYASHLDERQERETGRARLGWEIVVVVLLVLLVSLLTLGTILYLPSLLFG